MYRRTKIQFQQWLYLSLIWQLMALWITVYDHLVVHSGLTNGPDENYSFLSNWILNIGGTIVGSLIGGSLLIFYINRRFAEKPYSHAILAVILIIISVMTVIILIIGYFYVTILQDIPFGSPDFNKAYIQIVLDPVNLKDTLIWATITAITQFVFQMNTKFGYGSLWKIITGKYRRPKEEKRIFMFVDLNSSTTIAEQLGEETYYRLLKDFFARITIPIIENDGEIYQYVGDEIVVAWPFENGIRENHCINCFFEIKKEIEKNRDYFMTNYGLVPSFKAGIHFGKVIAGEIGIFKRDITFSGDVLNTTSRIQGKCKEFDVEVLASSELLHALPALHKFVIRELGSIELRGKEHKVELSTLALRTV